MPAMTNALAAYETDLSQNVVRQNPSTDTVPGSTATTQTITVGGSAVSGYINTVGDQDWYRVTLTAGQTYVISATDTGGLDTYLRLLNSSGVELANDDDSGPGTDSLLSFTATTSGTYYISAEGFGADTGSYSVAIVESVPLPVFTIPEIADQLLSGYWNWSGSSSRQWAPANDDITYNLQALSPERAALARLAFETWEDVCGLTFTEVTTGGAEITFDDTDEGAYSSSTTTGNTILSSFINIEPGWSEGTSDMDDYTFETFIHEIGHSLGLGHGGNYNGSATYGVDNHYANDTRQFSVMSYMGQENFDGASTRFVMTPQMADIFAMISMYGAGTARTTDTVYGHNVAGQDEETAPIYNFNSYTTAPCFTIYDTGGTDTLDCSGYANDQLISLVGGTWSDIGGLENNIGIYLTSVIENAKGGTGLDKIYGNTANNVLTGNGGADELYGDAGNDYLYGGSGSDKMYGGTGNDTYTVSSVGDVVTELAGQGTDHVYAAIDYSLSGKSIEKLTLTGTAAIDGTGNTGNNTITGNSGSNVLSGGDGNDTLVGGAGNDYLYGGAGNDTMSGGTGNDTYTVGAAGDKITELAGQGSDKVYSAISYTLGFSLEHLTLTGSAAINGTGNSVGNIMAGNAGANTLEGKGGNDTLTGAGGADKFLFASALGSTNIDTITDMTANVDKIHIDNAIFTAFAAGNLSKFTTGASASGSGAQVVYNSATGALFYDSDGAGGAAQQQFAILSTGLGLDAQDFFVV